MGQRYSETERMHIVGLTQELYIGILESRFFKSLYFCLRLYIIISFLLCSTLSPPKLFSMGCLSFTTYLTLYLLQKHSLQRFDFAFEEKVTAFTVS